MNEAKFGLLLRHWLRANPLYTCALETKITATNSLPFAEVKQAQIDWGLAIQSDEGVLIRTQAVAEGMPDYIYLRKELAYIVVKYPTFFCLIPVDDFLLESQLSDRKSLLDSRAREIAAISVDL